MLWVAQTGCRLPWYTGSRRGNEQDRLLTLAAAGPMAKTKVTLAFAAHLQPLASMQTTLSNSLVTIRRYDMADVPLLFEAARESPAEVSVWLPWCHRDYSMEDSLEWVLRSGKQWDDGREFHFGVFDSASGAFVGGVGLNELKREHRLANLGYWVRTAWAGRGVATAAARLAAQFGFEELALDRIEILAALGNKRSQRVARKLGALREGVLRNRLVIHGEAHDAVVFSLIGSEWKPPDKLSPLRRGDAEGKVTS